MHWAVSEPQDELCLSRHAVLDTDSTLPVQLEAPWPFFPSRTAQEWDEGEGGREGGRGGGEGPQASSLFSDPVTGLKHWDEDEQVLALKEFIILFFFFKGNSVEKETEGI